MAPFLPVIGLSKSQSVRIGRSPNAVRVTGFDRFPSTSEGVDAQTGALAVPAYIDLGDAWHRRDLAHHSSIGGVVAVGTISQTVTSDLFVTGQPTATAGTGALTVTIGNFTLKSRTYGNTLAVTGTTLTLAPNPVGSARTDLVVVDEAGNLSVVQGTAGAGTPAVPANKTQIAAVVVPANATSTTSPTSATADAPTS